MTTCWVLILTGLVALALGQTCAPVTEELVLAVEPGDVASQTYGRLNVRGNTNLACNTTTHNFKVTGQMRAEQNVHVVGALLVDGNITVNGAFELPGALTGLTIDDSVVGGIVPGAGTFTALEATQSFVFGMGTGTAGHVLLSNNTAGTAVWSDVNAALNLVCLTAPAGAGSTPRQVAECALDPSSVSPTLWPGAGTTLKQVQFSAAEDIDMVSNGVLTSAMRVFVGGANTVDLGATHTQTAVLASERTAMYGSASTYSEMAVVAGHTNQLNTATSTYTNVGLIASTGVTFMGENSTVRQFVTAAISLSPRFRGANNVYSRVFVAASETPNLFTDDTDIDTFTNVALLATKNAKIWDNGGAGVPMVADQVLLAACDGCILGTIPGAASNRVIMGGTGLDGDMCGDNSLTTHNLCVNDITLNDGANIGVSTGTGTQIGTTPTQKLGLYGVTPVAQPASTNTTAGYSHPGTGTMISTDACTTGGLGPSCYTYADVVLALKKLGVMAL